MQVVATTTPSQETTPRILARIAKIINLTPIPNADRLLNGNVLGWQFVIVDKSTMEGEVGVFFEPDSQLPSNVDWLSKDQWGMVIKTIKLRGSISQGLFHPLREFPEALRNQMTTMVEGDDVTTLLNVVKRTDETDEFFNGKMFGLFCNGVSNPPPKTDEPRVQNSSQMLKRLHGHAYQATLKIDGSSATFALKKNPPYELSVNSRTVSVPLDKSNIYGEIALKYDLQKKMLDLYLATRSSQVEAPRYCIQGEVYGAKIQKDLLNLKDKIDFSVFSVWDSIECRYLTVQEASSIVSKLGLKEVPVLFSGSSFDSTTETCSALLQKAKGYYEGTSNHREGFVLRSTSLRERISLKVINNDYLIQKDGGGRSKKKSLSQKNKKEATKAPVNAQEDTSSRTD